MFDTATTSIDTLEQELFEMHCLHGPVWHRQIQLLRRLDLAQVASADGCRTMAEWVSSRLDVSPPVANDLLALARTEDPEVDRLLEAGDVGLERAVALTKLRNTGASDELVVESSGLDLAGLWRLISNRTRIMQSKSRRHSRIDSW